MAFVFDSTVGGASANSYVSVSEADDYFAANLDQAFWNIPLATKQAALVQATNRLEMEQYAGRRTDDTQTLQWPRTWIVDRDMTKDLTNVADFVGGQYYIPNNTIPKALKQATCEMALYLLKRQNGEFTTDDNDLETLEGMKIGPLDLKFKGSVKADRLPTIVRRLLQSIGVNAWTGEAPLTFTR